MNYWSRTGNIAEIASFLGLCLLWASGGILVASHGFRLKEREKLVSGLATGFLVFIVLSNLLAQLVPLPIAYWSGAVIIFLAGLGVAWHSRRGMRSYARLLSAWPQLLALSVIILVFTLILRGLAIFDDYYHLPMISVMATGDIPPHFFLDPRLHLAYHYGLQVFAAGMVRLGGFFAWSAWDISRAIVFGLTVMLAWLWIRRLTGKPLPAYLGAGLLIFGGGARWLLLAFPSATLQSLGANLHMDLAGLAAGGNLVADLTNRWPMDGSGPVAFPFAFASGIIEPLNMQLGATGAMWEMTILLLLLIWRPGKASLTGMLAISLVLASLALSAENVFALVVAGMVIILITAIIRSRIMHRTVNWSQFLPWVIPLVISGLLALVQGGYISGAFMSLVGAVTGRHYPLVTTDFQGFSLRWPPAVPSGHFGPLSLLDPSQIVIMLAEAGLALFLLPLAVIYWLRKIRRANRLPQALAAGAVISLLFPVFFRYGLDFDITRLLDASLWLSFALAFPILWLWLAEAGRSYRGLAGVGYGVAVISGLVMLVVELYAIPVSQTTYYLAYREGNLSRQYWNRLEKTAQILDRIPYRAVLLFGRASFAGEDVYQRSPEWKALVDNPLPASVAEAGYSYIYMDNAWWQQLSPETQAAYGAPCVHLTAEMKVGGLLDRRLFNVADCSP